MITKDNINNLIDFGGLLVYELSYFDIIQWKSIIILRTFNEDYAKEMFTAKEDLGLIVCLVSYMVQFNIDK